MHKKQIKYGAYTCTDTNTYPYTYVRFKCVCTTIHTYTL